MNAPRAARSCTPTARRARRPASAPRAAPFALGACLAHCGAPPPPDAAPPVLRVEYPASYARRPAEGATLTLRRAGAADAPVTLRTDAAGDAPVRDLPAGVYAVTATRALDEAEAFALTGHRRAVTLTATLAEQRLPPPGDAPPVVTMRLTGPRLGGLVIKEVYYTGAPGVGGNHYFHDQFVEVYNNSTEPIALDGLCVADVYGASGRINRDTPATPYQSDVDHVYASSVWQVPGDGGEHVLAPGQSAVIAQDGTNHQPDSTLDLSDADWETFNQRADGRDVDWPIARNLTRVHHAGGFDWLVTVFGPAIVIFRVDDAAALERVQPRDAPFQVVRVPARAVLDGVEALMDEASGGYKRLPDAIDRGFVFASGTYTGESARRRTAAMIAGRRVLADTDDSAADFEVIERPTPRGF